MKTLEEVLAILGARIDRAMLENYIVREWVRPQQADQDWYFEEIDIARIELVSHLAQEIQVNDEGIDVALSLLDQLYGLRAQMRHLKHAITQQPSDVQANITFIVGELTNANGKA